MTHTAEEEYVYMKRTMDSCIVCELFTRTGRELEEPLRDQICDRHNVDAIESLIGSWLAGVPSTIAQDLEDLRGITTDKGKVKSNGQGKGKGKAAGKSTAAEKTQDYIKATNNPLAAREPCIVCRPEDVVMSTVTASGVITSMVGNFPSCAACRRNGTDDDWLDAISRMPYPPAVQNDHLPKMPRTHLKPEYYTRQGPGSRRRQQPSESGDSHDEVSHDGCMQHGCSHHEASHAGASHNGASTPTIVGPASDLTIDTMAAVQAAINVTNSDSLLHPKKSARSAFQSIPAANVSFNLTGQKTTVHIRGSPSTGRNNHKDTKQPKADPTGHQHAAPTAHPPEPPKYVTGPNTTTVVNTNHPLRDCKLWASLHIANEHLQNATAYLQEVYMRDEEAIMRDFDQECAQDAMWASLQLVGYLSAICMMTDRNLDVKRIKALVEAALVMAWTGKETDLRDGTGWMREEKSEVEAKDEVVLEKKKGKEPVKDEAAVETKGKKSVKEVVVVKTKGKGKMKERVLDDTKEKDSVKQAEGEGGAKEQEQEPDLDPIWVAVAAGIKRRTARDVRLAEENKAQASRIPTPIGKGKTMQ